MSISSVGCTEVSEARSCELLSPIGARARARVRARGRVKSAPVRALPVPCRFRRVRVTVIQYSAEEGLGGRRSRVI